MTPDQMNAQMFATLSQIQRDVAEIKTALSSRGGTSAAGGPAPRNGVAGAVASDSELDSAYGDPSIRKDPPRWTGQSYVGYKLSETEPDFLECFASFKDWAADMDEQKGKVDAKGRPTAPMNRKDAARARGWAARLRARGGQPAPPPPANSGDAHGGAYDNGGAALDDIPF